LLLRSRDLELTDGVAAGQPIFTIADTYEAPVQGVWRSDGGGSKAGDEPPFPDVQGFRKL
jgi:hypothetical protein